MKELYRLFKKAKIVFQTTEQTKAWFKMSNLNLGGSTPIKLIQKGRSNKVEAYLDSELYYR